MFNGCALLPEDKYKSCSFSGECYSINETDKDKALDECKKIAEDHSNGSYFVLVQVSSESCD